VALHLTEADRRGKDLVAAALVAIALGSSGVGVTVAFAVIADLAVRRVRAARLVPFAHLGAETSRVAADGWMIADEQVVSRRRPAGRPSCPDRSGVRSVRSVGRSASELVVPVDQGAVIEVTDGSDRPVDVKARRFARAFTAPPITRVAPKRTAVFRVPDDRSSIPWKFEVEGAGERVLVCRVR
jgi:hypothetical protein